MRRVWEEYGKGIGKAWERHGKSMGKVWERYGKGMCTFLKSLENSLNFLQKLK